MLAAEQHALDVDRLHLGPLGLGDLVGELGAAGDAGIVDQHVDAAEVVGDLVDGAGDVGLAGDVDMPVAGVAAVVGDGVGECLAFAVHAVEDRDRRAFFRQSLHAGMADADRAAGDDAGLALDTIHRTPPSRWWRHAGSVFGQRY